MKPLISVIIPVYNVKNYIREAIDSLVLQKEYLHEIILIDDGSTDGSGELIEKLYGGEDFFKIIHKKNEGQGIARNWGTEISTGNFLYYFDSDDIVIDSLFKKFHLVFSQNPDMEIFCFSGESFLDDRYSIEEVKNKNRLSKDAQIRKVNDECNSGEEAFHLLMNNKSFFVYTFLYIFKKKILTNYNICFKPIRNEDGEFINHLFLHAGKTIINSNIYVKHRIRTGSTMQVERSFKDIYGILKTIESLDQLSKLNYLKSETRTMLKNKISGSARVVIKIKASSKMRLTKEEKKIFKTCLKPYLHKDIKLLFFYYTYSYEYKLRKFKEWLFRK